MLARAFKGNWQYFVMGYHENIWLHQCQEDINSLYHFERIPGNIPGAFLWCSLHTTSMVKIQWLCHVVPLVFNGAYTMNRYNYIEIHPTQAQVANISYHHPSKYLNQNVSPQLQYLLFRIMCCCPFL
jgi:hypothetical protein